MLYNKGCEMRGEEMYVKSDFCNILISEVYCFNKSSVLSLPFGEQEKNRLLSIQNDSYASSSFSALRCLEKLLNDSGFPVSEADYTIVRPAGGKPYFKNSPLQFNVSHSHGAVAVALSDHPIGIDIEFIDESRDVISLARRFFAPREFETIEHSKSPVNDFFSMWTKKEAFAKLSGKGLASICKAEPIGKDCFFDLFELSLNGKNAFLSVCSKQKLRLNVNYSFNNKGYSIYEVQN